MDDHGTHTQPCYILSAFVKLRVNQLDFRSPCVPYKNLPESHGDANGFRQMSDLSKLQAISIHHEHGACRVLRWIFYSFVRPFYITPIYQQLTWFFSILQALQTDCWAQSAHCGPALVQHYNPAQHDIHFPYALLSEEATISIHLQPSPVMKQLIP